LPPATFTASLTLSDIMFYLFFIIAVVFGLMLFIAWFG
jgi:hypothetical protein